MKITVTSDDGTVVEQIPTDDLDFAGHSLNRAVLELRLEAAVNRMAEVERKQEVKPS